MKLSANPLYANLPPRIVAAIIDWQLRNLLFLLSLQFLVRTTTMGELIPALINTITFFWLPLAIIYPLLIVLLMSKTGYTPGKALVGIQVADSNHQPLTFIRSVFREFIGKRVSSAFIFLGHLSVATDENHQAWHDHFSESYAYKIDDRLLMGAIGAIVLAGSQIFLTYSVTRTFISNQELVGDLQFVFEPLLKLIS